jgi:hypothetical protein
MGCTTKELGFDSQQGKRFSSTPQHPDWLYGLPSLLSSEYQGHFFPRGKAIMHEVNHSPPSTAEVKNVWNYTSTPSRLHCIVLN